MKRIMSFMRNGFDEILEFIKIGLINSEKDIENKLNYFTRTCMITSGVDVIALNKHQQISTEKMYHYYALYNS
jgi:hypothetical protein